MEGAVATVSSARSEVLYYLMYYEMNILFIAMKMFMRLAQIKC